MSEFLLLDDVRFSVDFPYTISWLYPRDMNKEKIFQENLSKSRNILQEIVKETELLDGNQQILKIVKFDSQKEKQNKLIEDNKKKLNELFEKLNEGISPYKWKITKNVDDKFMEYQIKCDYLLTLVQSDSNGIDCLEII